MIKSSLDDLLSRFNKPKSKWWNLSIENKAERKRVRKKAEREYFEEFYSKMIKESSDDYQENNFDVLPTKKCLADNLGISENIDSKYGRGFYIRKSEHTKKLIYAYLIYFPTKTQNEISSLMKCSIRTVKFYWNK